MSIYKKKDPRFARVGNKSYILFGWDVLHCKIILNHWTHVFQGPTYCYEPGVKRKNL